MESITVAILVLKSMKSLIRQGVADPCSLMKTPLSRYVKLVLVGDLSVVRIVALDNYFKGIVGAGIAAFRIYRSLIGVDAPCTGLKGGWYCPM